MRRTSAVLLSASIFLGAAGCSSGSGSGEDRLTEEEFLTQADAICEEGNAEVEEAIDGMVAAGGSPTDEEAQELLDLIIANIRGQLDDIEGLSPPEDLEPDVDDLIETARGDLDALEEAGVDALTEGSSPFEESNAKATELGLEECAADE